MLGLPQSTEVKRSLPKAQLYRQLDWKPVWRDAFDAEGRISTSSTGLHLRLAGHGCGQRC